MKKALIVLLALAFVGVFAMPAAAADKAEWSFYGSARVQTWSQDHDKVSDQVPTGFGGVNGFDDRDTVWGNQGNSRFGANAKVGSVSGRVEIRESSEFRVVWGEWDFGMGKLGVGKTYTPANMFYSNQVAFGEQNMLNMGGYYNGADHMLRLRFEGIADMVDFDLAFVDPNSAALVGGLAGTAASTVWQAAATPLAAGQVAGAAVGTMRPVFTPAAGYQATDIDTTLPQIEGRLLMNWGAIQAEFGGAWLEFENVAIDGTGAEREYDVDAWTLHFGLKFAMGPFYANGNIHTGENNTYLGQWMHDTATATYDAANDTIIDSDRWGYQLVAGFKLNDMLSFEAGYGAAEMEPNVVGMVDDEVSTYYLQAVLSPAQGVLIIPEIGERDYENDTAGNDEGESFYFGAVWKISF